MGYIKYIALLLILVTGPSWAMSVVVVVGQPATTPVTVYIGTTTCGAQACTYAGSDGTYLNPASGDTNYATSTAIVIDGNGGLGIIYLDTSNIPASKTITSAKLWVYCQSVDNSPGGNITVHQMLHMPGDGADTTFTETEATYNEQDATDDFQWGADTQANPKSGTDYNASALVTVTTGDFTASQFTAITSVGLTTLVDGWYKGTTSNYGILILCSDNFSDIQFRSEDMTTANQRFYWEITYQ